MLIYQNAEKVHV